MKRLVLVIAFGCGGSPPVDQPAPAQPSPADAAVSAAALSAPPSPVGKWRVVNAVPAGTVRELARSQKPAPGRTDSHGQISGYCPPQAVGFAIGGGRSLVTREPCSGTTEIAIVDASGERRVADSILYGVTGKWHVMSVGDDLLLMVLHGSYTALQLVDLRTARASWVPLPPEFERASGLEVRVKGGEVFVSGGMLQTTVGETGCENPPPNMGCDPVPVTKQTANRRVHALRLR